MLNIRVSILLSLFLFSLLFARPSNVKTHHQSQETSSMIQQLGAGNHAGMSDPLIVVARDLETYRLLRMMREPLPEQNAKFFESNVVIAVFLGTRPSGGYSVEITEGGNGQIEISEKHPPKGAIVKTVLSSPYKVVAVRLRENEGLKLSLDKRFQAALRSYNVTNGEMIVSGGFAGKQETVKLQGKIDVMKAGDFATFFFDVQGSETRRLVDVASSKVDKSKVVLKGVDAFRLAGAVNSPFRISGEFSDQDKQLVLEMVTVPDPLVSDNFGAFGKLVSIVTP